MGGSALKKTEKTIRAADALCAYLARRDIPVLSAPEIKKKTGSPRLSALLAYGCDLTEVPECAARAFHLGLCNVLVFSGGIGHGTDALRKNARIKYGIERKAGTEADIMAEIAIRFLNVPKEKVLVENRSSNSGENASFSLALLRKKRIPSSSLLLIQDPLMQQRSHLATQKYLEPDCRLLSFAPFLPRMEDTLPWPEERFFELLLREIPRIYDNEYGYGPKGSGFIAHADIPDDVMKSYRFLSAAIRRGPMPGDNNLV
jgi:hypothetical protein